VGLGLAAIYLLLPRPGNVLPSFRLGSLRVSIAALLAVGALILAGWLLIETQAATPETILFYAFSAVAVVSGTLLVTQRNPVHGALAFALVVLSTCGLFLLLAAPFLMAATIIIYAGAIIVTFLFVIMLAQQAGLSNADARSREPFLSCFAGFVLLCVLLFILERSYDTRNLNNLLAQLQEASQQSSIGGIRAALGVPDEFFKQLHTEASRSHVSPTELNGFDVALDEAQEGLNSNEADLDKIRGQLTALYQQGNNLLMDYGNLKTAGGLALSHYSELVGSNALPHQNVGYLGRTLFADYLLPVELGGTLLLVASIGAIAIAGRRTEGLR
jgi:NADH:ubiquinone oxidoreductase subunit 6 (subunit J)